MKLIIVIKIALCSFLNILQSMTLSAQLSTSLHMDRPFYFNGDSAYFSFILNQEQYDIPLKFSISEISTGVGIDEYYLLPHQGRYMGGFAIPHYTNSGYLCLNISASIDSLPSNYSILSHQVLVINDTDRFENLPSNFNPSTIDVAISDLIKIEILNGPSYPGKEIKCQVEVFDSLGNTLDGKASISIYKQPFENASNLLPSTAFSNVEPVSHLLKKVRITGEANYTHSPGFLPNDVVGIYTREDGNIHLVKTNAIGQFSFDLPPGFEDQTLQFIHPYNKSINVSFPSSLTCLESKMSRFDSIEISAIKERNRKRKKINYLFNLMKRAFIKPESFAWPFEPDYMVDVDNYERVNSLTELTKLIVTPLRIKIQNGQLDPVMVNPIRKPFFEGPPIFFIDHYLVSQDKALNIRMDDVQRIDYYHLPKSLKHFDYPGRNGVVSLLTKHPERYLPDNYYIIPGLRKSDPFPYRPKNQKNVPFIDPLILWAPNVSLTSDKPHRIQFVQSDEIGQFVFEIVIHVEGRGFMHGIKTYECYKE